MERFALPAAQLAMQAAWRSGAALVASHWMAPGDPRGLMSLPLALLTLLAGHHVPRRPSQTPDEYLASWQKALPGGDEAAGITVA